MIVGRRRPPGIGQVGEGVQVSAGRRRFHMATEALSLLTVPLVLAAAATHHRTGHRMFLRALAYGILVVDTALLATWPKR